jgi:hypothetical protein
MLIILKTDIKKVNFSVLLPLQTCHESFFFLHMRPSSSNPEKILKKKIGKLSTNNNPKSQLVSLSFHLTTNILMHSLSLYISPNQSHNINLSRPFLIYELPP